MNGYEALRESAAWIDLSARGKIRLGGYDRARLLHAITTNHIQQLTPGTGCYVFFLNAQGHVLADASILCCEDHLLLDTEPEIREHIYAHLDQYIIADDVTLEDTTARTTTLAVEGPRSAEVLARIVRLEHGNPHYGEDTTDLFFAQETNQSHALHFSKGCYLGQEIVERARAQLHRRLTPLNIDGNKDPTPGTKVTTEGNATVEIASAVFLSALAKVVALAYVRTA